MQFKKTLVAILSLFITLPVVAKVAHCPNPANIKYQANLVRYVGKQDGITWMGSGSKMQGKILFKYTLNDTTDGVDNNQITCSYVDSADPFNRYFVISPANQQNAKVKWTPDQTSSSHWRTENASAVGSNDKISSTICYSNEPKDCPYTVEKILEPKVNTEAGNSSSANNDDAAISASKKAEVIDLSNDH